jgi:hypothetical protein
MSSAISFYTTFQQLMLSVGICFSATVLHVSSTLLGHAQLMLSDFSSAFLVISGVSIWASLICMKFSPDAGHDMSGYRLRMEAKPLARDKRKKSAAGV